MSSVGSFERDDDDDDRSMNSSDSENGDDEYGTYGRPSDITARSRDSSHLKETDDVGDDENDDEDGDEDDDDEASGAENDDEEPVPEALVVDADQFRDDDESEDEADGEGAHDEEDEDVDHEAESQFEEEEEEEEESFSHATDIASPTTLAPSRPSQKRSHAEMSSSRAPPETSPAKGVKRKKLFQPGHNLGKIKRTPMARGLTIPFRSVKRTMKMDPDIGTIQNEAAILVTYATELFLKKIAQESWKFAKKKGRNMIKYEDIAEARVRNSCLSFLDLLFP